MMKAATLQSPPEWINQRYYEIQNTPIRVAIVRNHGPLYYLKEGAEVGLGIAVIYLMVALAALI